MQHGICFLFLLISTATSVYSPSYIGKLIDSVQNMQYNNVIFYSKALILLTIIALIIEYWKANRYNYFEAKYKRTRAFLEEMQGSGINLIITTKSNLVTRDIDLIKTYPNPLVAWSINTLDEEF